MEGDLTIPVVMLDLIAISTHALTWRATKGSGLFHCPCRISTHALTWRATSTILKFSARIFYFYPRPHMEGDAKKALSRKELAISTHALTWRATESGEFVADSSQFLPTPSHGGRLATVDFSNDFEDFYPRPHMEGDLSGAL